MGQFTSAGPGCDLKIHDTRWFYPTTGIKPLKFILETLTNHVKCLTSIHTETGGIRKTTLRPHIMHRSFRVSCRTNRIFRMVGPKDHIQQPHRSKLNAEEHLD